MDQDTREMMPEGLAEGLEILRARRDKIVPDGSAYTVPRSPESAEMLAVSRTPGGVFRCSCGASCGPGEENGTNCSHMWAAMVRESEVVAELEAAGLL